MGAELANCVVLRLCPSQLGNIHQCPSPHPIATSLSTLIDQQDKNESKAGL